MEKETNKKLLEEETVDELAKELIEFAEKKFPEAMGYLSDSIRELFWQKRGIQDRYDLPPELRLKIERVEAKAEKIMRDKEEIGFEGSEWFKTESVDQIVNAMLKFADESNFEDYVSKGYSSPWVFMEGYWTSRGFNRASVYSNAALRMKLEKIGQLVKEELENKREEFRIHKEKEFIEKTVPAIIEWLESKGETKVTRTHIDLFLLEKEVSLPKFRGGSNLKNMLYLQVKTKFR